MRGVARLLPALGLAFVVLGAGCNGEGASSTYAVDEVIGAFEAASFPVFERPPPEGTAAAAEGTYLFPRRAAPVVIYVATDEAADEAWADYVRLGGDDDSLTVRRANVVAISDGGLTTQAKRRVRAAMAALPERGFAVDVVEDH